MDFKTHLIQNNDTSIYLMLYNDYNPIEYLDKLTPLEIERYHEFNNIKRKREFVATRLLRHQCIGFQHIHYDPNGAPFIDDEGFISISHSARMVGLAINKNHSVGLDLEFPRENILKIKSKFLSNKELEIFDTDNPDIVTKLWSAKEALYKLAGRKQIIFSEELCLSIDENENWVGTILNPDHELYVKLDIFEYNGAIITINSEAIERIE